MKHEQSPDHLQEYVRIVRSLIELYVKHPDFLDVTGAPSSHSSRFFISVRGHKADQSKLIGAQARNVKALQTIMQAIGSRRNHTINVSILETEKGEDEPQLKYEPDEQWYHAKDVALATVLSSVLTPIVGEHSITPQPTGDRTKLCVESEVPIDPDLESSLSAVFRAIGRTRGRIVSVHATTNQSDADVVGSGVRPG